MPDVAPSVEPSGPSLDETLLKFLAHLVFLQRREGSASSTKPEAATDVFKSCAPAA